MNQSATCRRKESRTALFVLGTLHARGLSSPVKLRNIAANGALVEGGDLPPPGTGFELVRGPLQICGEIVWRADGKAGLRFDRPTDTAQWLPAGHRGQQQVDDTFQRLKTEAQPQAPRADATPLHASAVSPTDLNRAATALDDLADALADDPAVLMRHGSKLQALDIASQLLRRMVERAG